MTNGITINGVMYKYVEGLDDCHDCDLHEVCLAEYDSYSPCTFVKVAAGVGLGVFKTLSIER